MSIASQITRLQSAKAAIKAALEAKGLTVSSSLSISDYAPLIAKLGNYVPPSFGGLEISSGPLYYGSNGYEIKDSWDCDSYNSVYGKVNGSTYFIYSELGELFEKSGFNSGEDGDIENLLDPLDGWRLPTKNEWEMILTTDSSIREGSTVNGSTNKHFALVQLTDSTYSYSSTPYGLLIFPDGLTITGKALSGMDNNTMTSGITEAELNTYLTAGCVFLPASGYYYSSWTEIDGSSTLYWSSTHWYYCEFNDSDIRPSYADDEDQTYYKARLVRSVQ